MIRRKNNTAERTRCVAVFFLLAILAWVSSTALTYASTPFEATVSLVDTSVIVGQPVTLDWYVVGGPASCSINNGVGDFTTTQNIESGSVTATPPASGDPFIISCSRGGDGTTGTETVTDQELVIPDPTISLSEKEGNTVLENDLVGYRFVSIVWDTDHATECSDITYTTESDPTTVRTVNDWEYDQGHRFRTTGEVDTRIYETTTYYITCQHIGTGSQTTESFTLTLTDPDPPEPVAIDVIQPTTEPTYLARGAVRQYGEVQLEFQARNAAYCRDYSAYNLHEYPTVQTNLPEGYDAWFGTLYRLIDLRLGTSTVLTVTCGRDAITLAGVTYPAASTTLVKTFILDDLPSIATTTGTSTPIADQYANATIIATPTTAERDLLAGGAYIDANLLAANVDYCNLRAYRASDLSEYQLANWTRDRDYRRVWSDVNQNINATYTPLVAESTILEATCRNIYDDLFGSPVDNANAFTITSTTVTITDPPGASTPPRTWIYSGPSLHLTADEIWNDPRTTHTNMTTITKAGMTQIQLNNLGWDGTTYTNNQGDISFVFDHPHGGGSSDVYNLHFRYCDESDGDSLFAFSTDGSGPIGSIHSNVSYPGQHTDCAASTQEVGLIAEGIVLTDGDTITISCTSNGIGGSASEWCRFSDMYIGTGSGGRVATIPTSTSSPENRVIWMSETADSCGNMVADTIDGTSYAWSYDSNTYGSVLDPALASEIEYNVTCSRPVDNLDTTEDIEVVISTTGDIATTSEETATSSVAYDIGACWDVVPDPDQLLPVAPTDQVVAPTDLHLVPGIFVSRANECVPLVDLSVSPVFPGTEMSTDSVVDIADGVDNVNGTYDLTVIPFIQNLAPVDLPENSATTYSVALSGGAVNEIRSGAYNTLLPANSAPDTHRLTTEVFNGISFGDYTAAVRFNLDGAPNYPDSNFGNNLHTESFTLDVPMPHMTLSLPDNREIIDTSTTNLEPPLIRAGDTIDLSWSVNVNYPMDCTLTGPSIGTQAIALDGVGAGDTVGSNAFGTNPPTGTVTASIESTSEFFLECIEPTTSRTFTQVGIVELVPTFLEI